MPRTATVYSNLHHWSVAVTPTFPSRETLDRLRFRPVDVGIGIFVLLLIYIVVRVGAGVNAPANLGHPPQRARLSA